MEKNTCSSCLKPKANRQCELCNEYVCKLCAQHMPDGAFAFLTKIPADLSHSFYCPSCFDSKVVPELDVYNQTMEQAKDINIFFKTQGKETRTFKRKEHPVQVTDCGDYDEAILRLAFLAAKLGYNSLIDVQMHSKKAIINKYQSTIWSGTGIPTNITDAQLNIRRPNNPN